MGEIRMIRVLIECEHAHYRDPIWSGPSRAAMAHVDCGFQWGTDPLAPIMSDTGWLKHLAETPEHLRCLYPYAIGKPAVTAYNGSPGHDWTTGKQPDATIGAQQAKYVQDCLTAHHLEVPEVFTDFEEPFFSRDGTYAPQSKRVAYLRKVLSPLIGPTRINTNFVRCAKSKPVLDCFGNPHGSGAIDSVSSVTCYAASQAEWAKDRRNVRNCVGTVYPHLPPVWTKDEVVKQSPDEMLRQIREAILWDVSSGVRTFIFASYMIERAGPNGRDMWAEAMATVDQAVADAGAVIGEAA